MGYWYVQWTKTYVNKAVTTYTYYKNSFCSLEALTEVTANLIHNGR